MAYNDPYGDHHEQGNLLGGSAAGRLNDDFKQLFGEGTIRHSDFRAGSIAGVKITTLGKENFESYVDNHADLKELFAEETSMDKQQFGKLMWKNYVNSKSNVPTSIEQRRMAHDGVTDRGTWIAPQQTARGTPQPTFNPPVTVELEFGDTVEFEVIFNDMGDKFENFRRYMNDNYQWTVNKKTGTTITSPIRLTTTAGLSRNQHAFQARYTFTTAEFDGDQTFYITFTPKDPFNNHDNMSSNFTGGGSSWGVCCILKPKPVSAARAMKLTVDYDMNELSQQNTLCVDEGTTVQLESVLTIQDPTTSGDTNIQWRKRSDVDQPVSVIETKTITSEQAPVTIQIGHPVAPPDPGNTTTVMYQAIGTVRGEYYDHEDNVISNWKYNIQSDWTPGLYLARAPLTDLTYCSDISKSLSTSLQSRAKARSFDINTMLQPGEVTGFDLPVPSVLIEARNGTQYLYFTISTEPDTQNVIEYYADGQWNQVYSLDESSTVINKNPAPVPGSKSHDISPPVDVYNTLGTPWPKHALWRLNRVYTVPGSGDTCNRAGASLSVVTMDQQAAATESVSVEIGWNAGIELTVEWQPVEPPVFEIETPTGTEQYTMTVEYIVEIAGRTITTSDTQHVINRSTTDGRGMIDSLVPGNQYSVSIRTKLTGTSKIHAQGHATRLLRWYSDWVASNQVTIYDCAEPDMQVDGVKVNDSVPFDVNLLTDYKHKSSSIMWSEANDEINLHADDNLSADRYGFQIIPHTGTWLQAKADAESRGGQLVCLDTQAKMNVFLTWWNAQVAATNMADNQYHWIGLDSYKYDERWVNGRALDESIEPVHFWQYDGNPSVTNRNGGASILIRDGSTRLDDHAPSSDGLVTAYIMEQYELSKDYINGSTFEIVNESMTWHDAKIDAQDKGGRLAVIDSASKQTQLFEDVLEGTPRRNYWIGLYYTGTGSPTDKSEWEWVNGEKADYDNWAGGEPSSHYGGTELAATVWWHLTNGKWNNIRDWNKIGYILERPTSVYGDIPEIRGVKSVWIASVKCNVRDLLTLVFSGARDGANAAITLTGAQCTNTIGDRASALAGADGMFYQPTSDDAFDTDITSEIMLQPANRKTFSKIQNFYVLLRHDSESEYMRGNRGQVDVEKLEHDLVRVNIQDVQGATNHPDSGDLYSDTYSFDVFANVII